MRLGHLLLLLFFGLHPALGLGGPLGLSLGDALF
jgi:hypothetical protein